jgi:hypothetical protein
MLTLMRDKDSAMQDILNETSVIQIILKERMRFQAVKNKLTLHRDGFISNRKLECFCKTYHQSQRKRSHKPVSFYC